jgi:hypothetical protein
MISIFLISNESIYTEAYLFLTCSFKFTCQVISLVALNSVLGLGSCFNSYTQKFLEMNCL